MKVADRAAIVEALASLLLDALDADEREAPDSGVSAASLPPLDAARPRRCCGVPPRGELKPVRLDERERGAVRWPAAETAKCCRRVPTSSRMLSTWEFDCIPWRTPAAIRPSLTSVRHSTAYEFSTQARR